MILTTAYVLVCPIGPSYSHPSIPQKGMVHGNHFVSGCGADGRFWYGGGTDDKCRLHHPHPTQSTACTTCSTTRSDIWSRPLSPQAVKHANRLTFSALSPISLSSTISLFTSSNLCLIPLIIALFKSPNTLLNSSRHASSVPTTNRPSRAIVRPMLGPTSISVSEQVR